MSNLLLLKNNNNKQQHNAIQTNWQYKISHLFRAHNGKITKKIVFITALMPFSFHMWVEFVVGSLLRSERFSLDTPVFLSFSKTNISKFQFNQESGRRRTTLWLYYLQIFIYLFIYSWRSSPRWTFGCITYTGRTSILSDQMTRYVALQPWNGIKQRSMKRSFLLSRTKISSEYCSFNHWI